VVGIEDDALYQQQAVAQVECVLGSREQRKTVPRILWTVREPEKPEQYGSGVGTGDDNVYVTTYILRGEREIFAVYFIGCSCSRVCLVFATLQPFGILLFVFFRVRLELKLLIHFHLVSNEKEMMLVVLYPNTGDEGALWSEGILSLFITTPGGTQRV